LERVRRYVGADVRAWFADPFGLEGRPRAGYFSSQAACFADPIERSDGRKSYSISCYQFDDASLRYVPVDQIIDLRAVRQTGTPTDTAPARAQQPDGGPPVSYRLAAILGNLPWKAQQLLQEPFADGRAVLRDGHYYLGDDYKLDPLVLFIAGERHITFASGTLIRRIDGSPDRSRWVGTCYRADVKRRIGA
jgi:hypothetical protein